MAIRVNLAKIMTAKQIKSKDLAKAIGITEQNLSILKNEKAKAIRFSTLEAICEYLNCQPGDILIYED
ncbi:MULTISPECIES: helix-turn-helix domain-containing protein [Francisella]|uniref:Helix-turn-helix family protein n=2 Tax=Francisella philomiragia TaxID=28110 RepID=A0AAW3DD91_9GAMM|nr:MULTISPECIES: helix-turn-helix transcriptional regulator [Francisella]AJI46944.1 helix-turn-helix family protein [Francisella philomiragia]AJI50193.1 helix-turn-helix family protein [Francisella philomiragia]AJI55716.1 helix-turn-helix family protein [Francisella philomiragia]AJI58109.1 helix-turn-helix family protein [Francisella philomiragia]AJI75549.1 helix-turn-helix family protein [Francisella philomiragia subsp. philomiragia ATCC 25015]